jgi:hypothetical protein
LFSQIVLLFLINFSLLVSTREEIPRRLKSAPLVRSLPPTSVLTIPEPRFITPIIPVSTNPISQTPSETRPRTRASSAKGRLNTTFSSSNEQIIDDFKQQRREIKSAQGIRPKDEMQLPVDENQKATLQFYNDLIQQQQQQQELLTIPPTPPPPPAFTYQKSILKPPSTAPPQRRTLRSTSEINTIPLNPHYVHRSGVITVRNIDKKPVVRESSASKRTIKHHRRHHHQHYRQEKRSEPLLALTPISQSPKLPFETDGIKLTYDPTLTLDDPSLNLTKYFIEGRLYLIKDQRYNVLENIDPSLIENYNQNLL